MLLLNGEHDFVVPPERGRQLLHYLGAPGEHKKIVFFEGGHIRPKWDLLMKETLEWYDRYLGPVSR